MIVDARDREQQIIDDRSSMELRLRPHVKVKIFSRLAYAMVCNDFLSDMPNDDAIGLIESVLANVAPEENYDPNAVLGGIVGAKRCCAR